MNAREGRGGGPRYRPVLEGLVPAGGDNHAVRLDPVYAFDGLTVRCKLKDLQEDGGSVTRGRRSGEKGWGPDSNRGPRFSLRSIMIRPPTFLTKGNIQYLFYLRTQ